MTVEHFMLTHPPVPELRTVIEEESAQFSTPNVATLAERLARVASAGMEADYRFIINKNRKHADPERIATSYLLTRHRPELAAIQFGAMVSGLSEVPSKGSFSNLKYRTFIDELVSPMRLHANFIKAMDAPKEDYDSETVSNIKRTIIDDPTYAAFFENPNKLPTNLREELQNYGNLRLIQDFLPGWKERAIKVVDGPETFLVPDEESFVSPIVEDQLYDLLKDF